MADFSASVPSPVSGQDKRGPVVGRETFLGFLGQGLINADQAANLRAMVGFVVDHPKLRFPQGFERAHFLVPQIFIDNQHIGGCDDLYKLDEENKLDALLK